MKNTVRIIATSGYRIGADKIYNYMFVRKGNTHVFSRNRAGYSYYRFIAVMAMNIQADNQ